MFNPLFTTRNLTIVGVITALSFDIFCHIMHHFKGERYYYVSELIVFNDWTNYANKPIELSRNPCIKIDGTQPICNLCINLK